MQLHLLINLDEVLAISSLLFTVDHMFTLADLSYAELTSRNVNI